MLLVVLRLVLAPLLVAAATLLTRRYGPTVGGRIVGLPLTAGPLLALLAAADGDRFAARSATFDQAGDVAASAWCVVYALAARRFGPGRSALAASGAFAGVAGVMGHLDLSIGVATLASAAALAGSLRWWPAMPAPYEEAERRSPGGAFFAQSSERAGGCSPGGAFFGRRFEGSREGSSEGAGRRGDDLVLRMVVAAAFTFALTESASVVGAGAAGLLGAAPLVTIILTVSTHARRGPVAATELLRGVMAGSFSVVGFLAVAAVALPVLGAPLAFTAALGTALAAQVVRRRPRPVPAPSVASAGDDTGELAVAGIG